MSRPSFDIRQLAIKSVDYLALLSQVREYWRVAHRGPALLPHRLRASPARCGVSQETALATMTPRLLPSVVQDRHRRAPARQRARTRDWEIIDKAEEKPPEPPVSSPRPSPSTRHQTMRITEAASAAARQTNPRPNRRNAQCKSVAFLVLPQSTVGVQSLTHLHATVWADI